MKGLITVEQQLKNFVYYLLDHDMNVNDLIEQDEGTFGIVASIAWRARVVFGHGTFENGDLNLLIERALSHWKSEGWESKEDEEA